MTAATTAILPPRPNPGPEPMAPTSPILAPLLALGLALVVVLLMLAVRWLRRRRRPQVPVGGPSDTDAAPRSPRRQMIAWSDQVRDALVARFGPAWAARTTEEIADDPPLVERLGPDQAETLVRFLRAADRAKFAAADDSYEAHGEADQWAAWVASFVADATAAGATSTKKGK